MDAVPIRLRRTRDMVDAYGVAFRAGFFANPYHDDVFGLHVMLVT